MTKKYHRDDTTYIREGTRVEPIRALAQLFLTSFSAYDAKSTRTFLRKQNFIPLISQNKRRSKKPVTKTTSRHRWIVERTFGHLNRWRGVFIRWNKKVDSYLASLQIAATFYALRYL